MLAPGLSRLLRSLPGALALALLLALTHVGPAAAATDGKLVLVLDSSGSMQDKIDGGSKIAVAKRALNSVVDHLPDDAQVGLRVYGANVDDENDPAACTDSQLVVPIGTGNKPALKDQIARYRPLGETPISYSLKQAAQDLGGSGRRTVVLVSDGRESCGEDPCVTAANLAKQGIDLKFDVIGLAVSGATRRQLKCIADRGHGTYQDAKNAKQIEDSLDRLATRAFRPFQLTGTPVDGSDDPATAPEVGPGQYLDQLPGRQDQKIWYRIPRTQPGSTIHVGVTARTVTATSAIAVELDTPDQGYCRNTTSIGYQGLTSGGISSWKPTPTNECNTADHLLVAVDAPLNDLVGADFELLVIEEPATVTERQLPPAEMPTWQPMPRTPTAPAPVAGLSLSDAPVLAPGAYSTTILTGETQVFAVDLAWGQRLQAEVAVAPRHGALAKALDQGDTVGLQLLGVGRNEYASLRATDQPDDATGMDPDSKRYVRTATTADIRFLDRTTFDGRQAGDLPGRQYVVISKNRYIHKQAFLVPYVLRLAVIGTAGDGAPEYVGASASPTPDPSDTPVAPPSTPPGAGGVPVGTAIAIGAGALVLGGVGTATGLAVRRRRRTGAG